MAVFLLFFIAGYINLTLVTNVAVINMINEKIKKIVLKPTCSAPYPTITGDKLLNIITMVANIPVRDPRLLEGHLFNKYTDLRGNNADTDAAIITPNADI